MILRDFACESGHRFEAGVEPTAENPPCPVCGSSTRRRYTAVNVGGRAGAGVSREQMPRSWQGIDKGNPDAIAHWRREIQKRERLEERHPELAGDRRPVLAHEGIFSGRPLRSGDDITAAVRDAVQPPQPSGEAPPTTKHSKGKP